MIKKFGVAASLVLGMVCVDAHAWAAPAGAGVMGTAAEWRRDMGVNAGTPVGADADRTSLTVRANEAGTDVWVNAGLGAVEVRGTAGTVLSSGAGTAAEWRTDMAFAFVGGTRAKARARSHRAANKRVSRATAKRLAALAHARGKHQKGLRELQGGWTFENSAYRREDFSRLRGQMPWPVESREVSMHFGYQSYGKLKVNNHGITIDCEPGSDVKSACVGEVTAVMEIGDVNAVVVRHGHFYVTYSNLATTNVAKGDTVEIGQCLGQVGDVGQLEFLVSEQSDHFLDPEKWLRRD